MTLEGLKEHHPEFVAEIFIHQLLGTHRTSHSHRRKNNQHNKNTAAPIGAAQPTNSNV